jgi:acetate CoA/acetoacetate CoA-transferase alpha subunit
MTVKTDTIQAAIARISDGDTIMVGGFGVPGTPFCLLDELLRQGQKELTLIKNDANEIGMGVDHLLQNGQVDKLVVSHIGLNVNATRLMNEGRVEVEFCAQGILAERIRCAGAGLFGFLTDIGIDTLLAKDKPRIEVHGRELLLEEPLKADFALLHAQNADPWGNLVYAAAAQNFNPLMAMAADKVIVEIEHLLGNGDLHPETIHTPAPFVDVLVELPELTAQYGVLRHGR